MTIGNSHRRRWILWLVRTLGGTASVLLLVLGRGIRTDSPNDPRAYWLGATLMLFAAMIATLLFIVSPSTRLAPPPQKPSTTPGRVGVILMIVGGSVLISVAVLTVAAAASPTADHLVRGFLTSPDLSLKVGAGIAAILAGMFARARSRHMRASVRMAAIPLALIFPLGVIIGSWAAWATLGPEWIEAQAASPGRVGVSTSGGGRQPANTWLVAAAGLLGIAVGAGATYWALITRRPANFAECMATALERGLESRNASAMCRYRGFPYEPPGEGALKAQSFAPDSAGKAPISFEDLIPQRTR